MSALLKLIMFFIAAAVMPVLSGLLPVSFLPRDRRRVPLIILTGYLASFALFEVLGLPILLFTATGDFALLTWAYMIADLALIAAGFLRCSRSGGIRLPENKFTKDYDGEAGLFWIGFAALLLFQIYMAYTHASFDGDDAYYVAQSVQTWQTGTMYLYVPYTGWTTTLDGRHALAMVPMWIAWVSTFCSTHPAIVTHSMLPIVLIPLADIALYTGMVALTHDQPEDLRRRMLPAAMIVIAVLQIFGNVSIYTPETFLLMRTWQGKSLFANLILPSAFALLLGWVQRHPPKRRMSGRNGLRSGDLHKTAAAGSSGSRAVPAAAAYTAGGPAAAGQGAAASVRTAQIPGVQLRPAESRFFWIMIVVLNIASGFCTSLAPAILTALLLGAAVLLAFCLRRWKMFWKMILACVPNYLYLMLLLRTMNSSWFSFLQGGRLP